MGRSWVFVLGSDPYGDPISYQVSQAPKFGTVSVSQYGVYTYTPAAGSPGTDTFTVALSTPGFHINLLHPFASQSTAITVTVNAAPSAPAGTVVANFNGPAGSQPDPALWTLTTGAGIDGGEQTYTNSPANVRLDGKGDMVIQALDTPSGYTSAMVTTQGNLNMQYGTMTASIKFPSGQGIWPAFWELGSTYSQATWNAPGPTGWPGAGEIDVMELVDQATTYHVTLHGPQTTTQNGVTTTTDYYGGSTNGASQSSGPPGRLPT